MNPRFLKRPTATGKHKNKCFWLYRRYFQSEFEAARFLFLLGEAEAGRISHLEPQPPFVLELPHAAESRRYTADFSYWRNGLRIIEDCKGLPTEAYKLRKWLFEGLTGLKITEITRKNWKEFKTFVPFVRVLATKEKPE